MRKLNSAGPAVHALLVAPVGAPEPPRKLEVYLGDERVGEPPEEKY